MWASPVDKFVNWVQHRTASTKRRPSDGSAPVSPSQQQSRANQGDPKRLEVDRSPSPSPSPSPVPLTEAEIAAPTAEPEPALSVFLPFPDDIWIDEIFARLSADDVLQLRLVCRAARELVDLEIVWRAKCEALPYFDASLLCRDETAWHAFGRLRRLEDYGRYAILAGFPTPVIAGLGIYQEHGKWVRKERPHHSVCETVIGLMRAETFVGQEPPRTPPQWIDAYTSIFQMCGNRTVRGNCMPEGCDWQLLHNTAYERAKHSMRRLLLEFRPTIQKSTRRIRSENHSSTSLVLQIEHLWERLQPRFRMIQHVFSRLSRYTDVLPNCVSLDQLPRHLFDQLILQDQELVDAHLADTMRSTLVGG